MKYKNDMDFTYMGNLHNAYYAREVVDTDSVYSLLKKFKGLGAISAYPSMPIFFALDYSTRDYLFMTGSVKTITGYPTAEVLEGGLEWIINEICEKHFLDAMNAKVFPVTAGFLRSAPPSEHQDYLFSFNNRMKYKGGGWIDILQRSTYITSQETGLPLYCLGTLTDITAFKRDNSITHTVEKINQADPWKNKLLATDHFYPFEEDSILSKQEQKVLKYMADGLSSKMIAEKLKISENTVSNHRQNMLRKTNTKNVAELVAFAIRQRII